ncbi:MAG TPA: hypothetical protein VF820_06650 [Patescibacteria group bacterium]
MVAAQETGIKAAITSSAHLTPRRSGETVPEYMTRAFEIHPFTPDVSSEQTARDALLAAYIALAEPIQALGTIFSPRATEETRRRVASLFDPESIAQMQAVAQETPPATPLQIAIRRARIAQVLEPVQLQHEVGIATTNSLFEARRQMLDLNRRKIEEAAVEAIDQRATSLASRDFKYQVLGRIFGKKYREKRLTELRKRFYAVKPVHTPLEQAAIALERDAIDVQKAGRMLELANMADFLLAVLKQLGISPEVAFQSLMMAVEGYYLEDAQI